MPVPKVEKPAPSSDPVKAKQLSLAGKWADYQFKTLKQCDLSNCTKREIKEYFKNTYDLDELLFSSIQDEKYLYRCPDRLRLPLVFYLSHPSSVYINKLMLAGLVTERVDFEFEKLFETGVDEMSWDDTENYRMGGSFQWPNVHDVLSYRDKVRGVIDDVIDSTALQLPVTHDSPWWAVFMGMEHERVHIETSSVLIRQLPVDVLKKPDNWTYAPPTAGTPPGPNKFVKVPAGRVVVGKPQDFPSFGWDNEYGRHQAEVPEFESSQYLVSNEEFLEFVNDGGYSKPELWTEEGWKWLEFRGANHPAFWVCGEGCKSGCGAELASYSHCTIANGDSTPHKEGSNGTSNGTVVNGDSTPHKEGSNGTSNGTIVNGDGTLHQEGSNGTSNGKPTKCKYMYRAMFNVLEMPLYWPVDVNYHEARAYCTWKGSEYRLPTEAEHHRMRGYENPSCDVSCDPSAFNSEHPSNSNLKYGSSTPVNMYPANSMGFYDVFGNVWHWTEDHFNGLPGFKTTYLYDDFSSPCFDGRHNMILGGSWISTGHEASRFARFAFRRHFFQHAGFRLVRSAEPTPVRVCNVEVFVLGAGVSDNPVTTPGVDLETASVESTNKQYHFETEDKLQEQLALEYGGQDNSASLVEFIDKTVKEQGCGTANAIQFGCGTGLNSFLLTKVFDTLKAVDYCGRFIDAALRVQSGGLVQYREGRTATVPAGTKPENVTFIQLTWIPNEIEGYDVAVFEFIDRLSEPRGWLLKLWEAVVSGGVVIFLTNPDSKWDETKVGDVIGKSFDLKLTAAVGNKTAMVWKRKS